jgi:hypothetical protein
MPSAEKMYKNFIDSLEERLAPLQQLAINQQIVIVQNKQIIDLLEQIRVGIVEQNRPRPTKSRA